MRAIQAGILICLTAITGLLIAIYRQQADPRAVESAAVAPVPAVPQPAPIETPAVELAPAPSPSQVATERRPAVRRSKPSPKPVEPASLPKPAPAPTATNPEPPAIETPRAADLPVTSESALPPVPALHEETPAKPRDPRVVTLPAGQQITVRLDSTLSTSRNRVDDTFFATLDEPILVDGLIIADKEARLEGRIVESEQAGRVKGLARLACELTKLHTDDGQSVPIQTSTFSLDGPSSRNDDLKKIGIGAGAGAILGAIFGGGKGAAIGAASGAGAGAGTAAATRGEPAVIEPETRLEFRLAERVTITENL